MQKTTPSPSKPAARKPVATKPVTAKPVAVAHAERRTSHSSDGSLETTTVTTTREIAEPVRRSSISSRPAAARRRYSVSSLHSTSSRHDDSEDDEVEDVTPVGRPRTTSFGTPAKPDPTEPLPVAVHPMQRLVICALCFMVFAGIAFMFTLVAGEQNEDVASVRGRLRCVRQACEHPAAACACGAPRVRLLN